MTLTDFLLARIAEERRAANVGLEHGDPDSGTYGAWGHARVLAECEAKRRIVGALDEAVNANSRDAGGLGIGSRLLGLLDAVHYLAAAYADHPDYRQEWKP